MKQNNKMKYVDIGVSVLFVVALVVIYFFWGCELDLYVTILAGLIIGVSAITTYMQYRKMKEIEDEQEQLNNQIQ